jgi:hypothetical protein
VWLPDHSSSESTPAERRRATPRVSSIPYHLARCLRPSPPMPHHQTSPCLSGLAATGNHAMEDAPHRVTAAGAFAPRPHSQDGLGRVAAGSGRHSRAREAFRPLAMADHNGQ